MMRSLLEVVLVVRFTCAVPVQCPVQAVAGVLLDVVFIYLV